jgi:hypothetical protein
MPAQNINLRRFLSSRSLTVVIVGSVVLVNSMAWGIPLLVGKRQVQYGLASKSTQSASSLATRALAQRRPTGDVQSAMVPLPELRPARRVRQEQPIPLPDPAPHKATRSGSVIANAVVLAMHNRAAAAALYPRPEAAVLSPITRPLPNATGPGKPPAALRAETFVTRKLPMRDIVLVSPYTPGVRVSSVGRGYAWRHHAPRSSSRPSTLDTARAIARRAAKRFEDMRNRIAKFDRRDKELAMQERRRQRALLPVAPRPPRIVNHSGSRSAVKSAQKFLRPRLVRRPLGRSTTMRTAQLKIAAAAPASAAKVRTLSRSHTATSNTTRQRKQRRIGQPDRVARLLHATRRAQEAQSNIQTTERRQRLSALKVAIGHRNRPLTKQISNTSRAAARQRDRAERHRRARRSIVSSRTSSRRSTARRHWRSSARRSRHAKRRRSRRIDGFRRNFHRQLANVNFFGTGSSN